MKKLLTSFAVVSVLATAGVEVGLGESNFRSYRYERIPSWSHQTGYQNQQVGGGWNFITYLHTNFYSGGY